MKKLLLFVVLSVCPLVAKAQTQAPNQGSMTDLLTWVKAQQYLVGTASPIQGKFWKNTYAATAWDAVSIGQSGLNVGQANALDFLDLGPCMDAATGRVTRYGAALGIHAGNLWNYNGSKLPNAVKNHVYLASLPDVTIEGQWLFPQNGSLKSWTWKDFMVTFFYRFAGTTASTPGS